MYPETRATVVELEGEEATLELENGSRQVVHVPEAIDVEIGMSVRIVADAIYLWGR